MTKVSDYAFSVEAIERAAGRSRRIGDHDVDALTQRCRECGIDLRVMAEGRSARCGQELIVDPADRRGFDAAPVRLARSAPMP